MSTRDAMRVKTARFADVVKRGGKPEAHLLLADPAKDRDLQAAIKSKRVMTVLQDTVGSKADRGVVGFEPGAARQYLIFPKTIRDFAGRAIVGIKYELWDASEPSKAERAPRSDPPRASKRTKPQRLPENVLVMPAPASEHPVAARAAQKPRSEEAKRPVRAAQPKRGKPEAADAAQLKKKVRKALKALEQGKQVAAFNILKGIVED